MPDNSNQPSSSTTSTTSIIAKSIDMPPPASKKRKRSTVTNEVPIRISAAPPTNVALPPPLMSYHPHLVPSYYPVYHQHPSYYLSVGPQPPISPSLSPTLSSASSSSTTTTSTQQQQQPRILPKSPVTTPNPTTNANNPPTAALAPAFNYFPYPIQVSPQLHPTSNSPLQPPQNPGSISPVPYHPIGAAAIRHNSVSSTTTTTADQREQARKVSHSAIERRRRERINDKITQLKDLIPACTDRENLHKMTILQSAIDYITYLKKLVEDLENNGARINEQQAPQHYQQTKEHTQSPHIQQQDISNDMTSVVNKSASPHVTSNKDKHEEEHDQEEEEEDSWSASPSPVPTSGLKPMDLIKMNKKPSSTMPPKIIIHDNTSQDNPSTNNASTTPMTNPSSTYNNNNTSSNSVDRHMNLENILC